jgi:hypothetical protein
MYLERRALPESRLFDATASLAFSEKPCYTQTTEVAPNQFSYSVLPLANVLKGANEDTEWSLLWLLP